MKVNKACILLFLKIYLQGVYYNCLGTNLFGLTSNRYDLKGIGFKTFSIC